MTTLKQQRRAAGEAYVAAAQAYVAAGVELAAFDAAVENRYGMNEAVGGGFVIPPAATGHSEFLRDETLKDLNRDHVSQIRERLAQLLRSLDQ